MFTVFESEDLDFRVEFVMDNNQGTRYSLLLITSKVSVYAVSTGNSLGWLIVVSLMVMEIDGSKTFKAANNFRCFTGRFTELSESELPNSTMAGVTYQSLTNFISVAYAIWRT